MAITLLKLALTLLIAAQGANVSPELRAQAVQVANQAITVAQAELAVKSAPTPVFAATGGVGALPPKEECSSNPELVVTPPSSSNLTTHQYSSSPPWTHLVGYTLTARVNDPCSKDWLIAYNDVSGNAPTALQNPSSFLVITAATGTQTVSISAHIMGYSKTIPTTTVSWDSPGIVCDWPGTCN